MIKIKIFIFELDMRKEGSMQNVWIKLKDYSG